MTENAIITASGRTREEITASVRIHMRNMVNNALEIGMDLAEMKDACQHGEWLPWLKEIGLSASTAANYMRIAREVSADSRMAQLPYTKILALMAAPPEEREALAEAAENMSAAEIRRLTDERNKAAAAANTETARADQAEEALRKSEADAKDIYDTNAHLRTEIQTLQVKLERAEKDAHQARCDLAKNSEAYERQKGRIDELKGKLLEAENHVIEVEKAPADYEQMKREREELIAAAADAEERASAAEEELERIQANEGTARMERPVGIVLGQAMNAFFSECEMMAFNPPELQRDAYAVRHCLEQINDWCRRMEEALETPVIREASVI